MVKWLGSLVTDGKYKARDYLNKRFNVDSHFDVATTFPFEVGYECTLHPAVNEMKLAPSLLQSGLKKITSAEKQVYINKQ